MDSQLNDAALAKMSSWVAAIADNLNNPIAGIQVVLSILERELTTCTGADPASRKVMEDSVRRIRDRLNTLGEYVAELIDVVRPGEHRPIRVEIRDLFADLSAAMATHQTLSIECSVAAGAEVTTADPTRIKAVLKALVLNGLEAVAADAAPKVRLSAAPASRDGKAGVALTLEDNGTGFRHDALARGQELFYSTKEAGTGLGLAVAKKFADMHGGTLELSRSAGLGGAAVTLFLPLLV